MAITIRKKRSYFAQEKEKKRRNLRSPRSSIEPIMTIESIAIWQKTAGYIRVMLAEDYDSTKRLSIILKLVP